MSDQRSAIGLVVILTIFVLGLGGHIITQRAQAADPPRLVKGQTYAVLYSCIAQVGCYGEILAVVEPKADGWVTFRDVQDGAIWDVNLNNVIAIQPYSPQTQRAAQ